MGFACLADEVHTRCLQRRGWPPVLVPLLSSKQSNQGINIIAMLKHMISCENMRYMVLMCLQFHLIEVYCKRIANSNSKFKFEKDPYACLLLFTHFKMVKHRNKLHFLN